MVCGTAENLYRTKDAGGRILRVPQAGIRRQLGSDRRARGDPSEE